MTTHSFKALRGQAAAKMAIVISILAFALVLAVQFALIGEAALALGQVTSQERGTQR